MDLQFGSSGLLLCSMSGMEPPYTKAVYIISSGAGDIQCGRATVFMPGLCDFPGRSWLVTALKEGAALDNLRVVCSKYIFLLV